ncbi:MAG: ATP-binding cassette domain-containing protein [Flavobacteriales bacterium]|nr:MAG: ATP-binding cassette domain-containing protein [Flavobacteriales bacterium]
MDIRINNLSRSYGAQKAVDDISFTVRTGEVLGFLGPNGAGKTTTMKMICGLVAADQGNIEVGGRDVVKNAGEVRKHIGYLPENNPLYVEMPVLDLLHFTAKVQGVPKDQRIARVSAMVEACGLGPERHKRVEELSKGYRQRVGLAQAMVHDPAVLILDEPTTGLDPNQIVEIRELIKEVGKAKTVIFSTHILPEVEATCDRILIINKGRIVADGDPRSLRQRSEGRHVLRVRIPVADPAYVSPILSGLPGVEHVEAIGEGVFILQSGSADTAAEVYQLCSRSGWLLTELSPMEARLEEVFRNLTLN